VPSAACSLLLATIDNNRNSLTIFIDWLCF